MRVTSRLLSPRRVVLLLGSSLVLAVPAGGCSPASEIDPSIQVVGPPAGNVEEPPPPKFKKGVPQAPTGLQRRRNPGAD